MKTREEALKKNYGFNKADYKYIPAGSEILKSIGQEVVYVVYNKVNEAWECKSEKAIITTITDFDPITMTYNCKYRLQSDPEVEKEVRIIPEGYSWGNPEETNTFTRFIPYSLHCKLIEDELFYNRLSELFESRDSLTIEQLKNISESKEKSKTLKYSNHIAAVIKLDLDGDILYFRLHDLVVKHKLGNLYAACITDSEGRSHKFMINSDEKSYKFEELGVLKFIDLAD